MIAACPAAPTTCSSKIEALALRNAALYYAACGHRVLPCVPGGKVPLNQHGVTDATTDAAIIHRWWNQWPDANVAIATDHLIVVDQDGPEGATSLAKYPLPPTVLCRTGRAQGFHRYYAGSCRSRTGLLPGVDIRGRGSYVIAPPSVHANGTRYGWVDGLSPDDLAPVPAPVWLTDTEPLNRREDCPIPAITCEYTSPYGRAALQGEVANLKSTPVGTRNDALNSSGFRIGRLVSGGEIIYEEAWEALCGACKVNRLLHDEAHKTMSTLKRSLAAGAKSPRHQSNVNIDWRLLTPALNAGAILYGALMSLTNGRVSQKEIAKLAGVKPRSVRNWKKELKAAGLTQYAEEMSASRFVVAPPALLTDHSLSPSVRVMWLFLATFAKAGMAHVGQKLLSENSGTPISTLKRHLSKLEAVGWLEIIRAPFNGSTKRREECNTYRLLFSKAATSELL